MRVLVAEDEAVSRRLLESMLTRWGYEVVIASDGLEAFRILHQPDAPQLAILDWLMPGLDGVQICQEIRRRRSEPYTYILLLTGKNTKHDVVEGLDAGADDYVIKPYDPQELQVRLRTGKRILYLQEQLIAAREALREQATRDSLTDVWNRSAILEILTKEISRVGRHGGAVAIAMLDLDHFKQINDVYGHLVGDSVLRSAAHAMSRAIRNYDAIGRIGGEEFLIVFPGCDKTNAVSHAERMRASIGRTAVQTPLGMARATASFGVAVFDEHRHRDMTGLMRAADAALYRAKENGRDRVQWAADEKEVAAT